MVEAAEKGLTWNGKKLKPGGTVCDASAGNTAPALAFVCAMRGYPAVFCTYKTMLIGDSARLKITGSYGPKVYMCPLPSKEILDQLDEKDHRMAYTLAGKMHMYELERDNPDVVWVDQIYNPYNTEGQKSMGREIYKQLDGKIDAWGCSIGSGGAFLGVTLALKELGVKPHTFGVTPLYPGPGEKAEFKRLQSREKIVEGIIETGKVREKILRLLGLEKWLTEESICDAMYRMGYPDEIFRVTSEEARDIANRLCREEGIWCGMSSGANVFVALKIAETMNADQNVVTTIVDRRDRYLAEYPNDIYVV
jgi:cysteine synthase A